MGLQFYNINPRQTHRPSFTKHECVLPPTKPTDSSMCVFVTVRTFNILRNSLYLRVNHICMLKCQVIKTTILEIKYKPMFTPNANKRIQPSSLLAGNRATGNVKHELFQWTLCTIFSSWNVLLAWMKRLNRIFVTPDSHHCIDSIM